MSIPLSYGFNSSKSMTHIGSSESKRRSLRRDARRRPEVNCTCYWKSPSPKSLLSFFLSLSRLKLPSFDTLFSGLIPPETLSASLSKLASSSHRITLSSIMSNTISLRIKILLSSTNQRTKTQYQTLSEAARKLLIYVCNFPIIWLNSNEELIHVQSRSGTNIHFTSVKKTWD